MIDHKRSYQWDAEQYAKYSASQYQWAIELIEKLQLKGRESVLDIGCGDGKVTAAIADRMPEGSVLGIDSSAEMIDLARRRFRDYPNSRLRFEHLDVRDLDEDNRFDVVFSNAALHWIRRHPPMLRRVRKAMKRGGRLLFQMGGSGNAAGVVAAFDSIINGRWASRFLDFEFPYGFFGPEEYAGWLVDAALDPVRLDLLEKDMRHEGRDGFAGWIRTTWLPYLERVPADLEQDFIDTVLDEYLDSHPMDREGIVHVRMVRLEVEAVKP